MHGRPLVFLDSAASSQKPAAVIEAMDRYYETTHANVHRAAYSPRRGGDERHGGRPPGGPLHRRHLTRRGGVHQERHRVAQPGGPFLGDANLGPGDAVVLTELEHHANIVPWQQLAAERGTELRWIPSPRTAAWTSPIWTACSTGEALALSAMSNVVGTITPVRMLTDAAHAAGALACIDAPGTSRTSPPTSTPSEPTSGVLRTQMLGPTGIGVLWGRPELLEAMPPFLGGGGMILDVTKDGFARRGPHKFEAGTPPIAEIVGLGAAGRLPDALGWTVCVPMRCRSPPTPSGRSPERFGDDPTVYGPAEPTDAVESRASPSGPPPHDLSQVLDQHGGVRPARPPLRQTAAHGFSGRRHRASIVVRVQTTRPTSTRWATRSRMPVGSSTSELPLP